MGIEPTQDPYQGSRLPLHQGGTAPASSAGCLFCVWLALSQPFGLTQKTIDGNLSPPCLFCPPTCRGSNVIISGRPVLSGLLTLGHAQYTITISLRKNLDTECRGSVLHRSLERVNGFEPSSSAWKAEALPLDDTRIVWWGVMDLNHHGMVTNRRVTAGCLSVKANAPHVWSGRRESNPYLDLGRMTC